MKMSKSKNMSTRETGKFIPLRPPEHGACALYSVRHFYCETWDVRVSQVNIQLLNWVWLARRGKISNRQLPLLMWELPSIVNRMSNRVLYLSYLAFPLILLNNTPLHTSHSFTTHTTHRSTLNSHKIAVRRTYLQIYLRPVFVYL